MVQPGTAHRQVEESAQVFSWFLTGTEAPQETVLRRFLPGSLAKAEQASWDTTMRTAGSLLVSKCPAGTGKADSSDRCLW